VTGGGNPCAEKGHLIESFTYLQGKNADKTPFGGQRSIQLSYECVFGMALVRGRGNSSRDRAKIRMAFFYTDFAPLPRG
jgi:hypothetical protein